MTERWRWSLTCAEFRDVFDVQAAPAIISHQQWKRHFLSAIESGKSHLSLDAVTRDDQCAFGRFLYKSASCAAIKELHASFHKEAGRILKLALNGHKIEARKALAPAGTYENLSTELIRQIYQCQSRCAERT